MKGQFLVVILVFGTLICSCEPSNKNTDSETRKTEIEEMEEWPAYSEIPDSVQDEMMLREAIRLVNENRMGNKFKMTYDTWLPDSSNTVNVELNLDFHFTKDKPHLFVRRSTTEGIAIDVFSEGASGFEKAFSHTESEITFVNDTVCDINGDGMRDFVVNTYGASGCCLKAFSDVYVLKQDKRSFTQGMEFINPTFSPEEGIVRGVSYGFAGDTDIYKYKWNGETIDTLEFVFYEKNKEGEKTGQVIVANGRRHWDNYITIRKLNTVPVEYRNIEGFTWFTGEGYE